MSTETNPEQGTVTTPFGGKRVAVRWPSGAVEDFIMAKWVVVLDAETRNSFVPNVKDA